MIAQYPVKLTLDKWAIFDLLGYRPHPGQREFHEAAAKHRFLLLAAGTRFGKSFSAAKEAIPYLVEPTQATRTWLVAPDYDLGEKEFRYVVDDLRTLKVPMVRCIENKHSGDLHVKLATGSEIQVKSANNPESLLGEEVDLMILCEGAKLSRDVWTRYLRGRLASRLGKVLIPTTPSGVDDFLYPTFYTPAVEGKPGYWFGQYRSDDNPHFKDDMATIREEFERAGRMDDYREQFEGQFVHRAGTVFKEFSRATHVVEPFEVPAHWPRWRGIDPGYSDPFACVWVAGDEEGGLVAYREWYVKRAILSVHAKAILSWPEAIAYTVVDPSARATRVDSGIPLLSQMAELGLRCVPGWNRDRQVRAWRIAEYLKVDPASGRPKLTIFRNCPNLIREMESFSYVEAKDGKNVKEKMQDKNDHMIDALGYVVMTRPPRARGENFVDPRSYRRYNEVASAYEAGRHTRFVGDDVETRDETVAW